MAEWHAGNFGKILEDSGLAEVASTVETAIAPVAAALDAVTVVLDAVKTFVYDPGGADWTAALETFIEELRDTLFGSGFYYLPMWDHALRQIQNDVAQLSEYSIAFERGDNISDYFQVLEELGVDSRVRFNDFLSKMADTLNDEGDTERPQMTGSTAAFVMVIAAPKPEELIDLVNAVGQLFPSDAEIQRIRDLFNWTLEEEEVVDYSVPPDWLNVTTGDILRSYFPEMSLVVDDYLDKAIKTLRKGKNASEAFAAWLDLVAQKVDQLNQLLDAIVAAISAIETILSASGIYVMYFETPLGVTDVRRQLVRGTNRPFTQEPLYIGGAMFLAGTSAPIETFRLLFGNV